MYVQSIISKNIYFIYKSLLIILKYFLENFFYLIIIIELYLHFFFFSFFSFFQNPILINLNTKVLFLLISRNLENMQIFVYLLYMYKIISKYLYNFSKNKSMRSLGSVGFFFRGVVFCVGLAGLHPLNDQIR